MKNDKYTKPKDNKFHTGNGANGKHYWLTPSDLMMELQGKFNFDFDACPFPKPESFDGLTIDWGKNTYVNPPFGSIEHIDQKTGKVKKKGPTAWMRKAIEENKKGKNVVVVYPIDKWILMMIEAGAEIKNLGDVKWVATEDGSAGKGTGRHIAQFYLPAPISGDAPKESHEIAKQIFYSPATNGQAENSINKGAELIEQYATYQYEKTLVDVLKLVYEWYGEGKPIADLITSIKQLKS